MRRNEGGIVEIAMKTGFIALGGPPILRKWDSDLRQRVGRWNYASAAQAKIDRTAISFDFENCDFFLT